MTDRPGRAVGRLVAEEARGCCEYCMSQEQFCPDPFSLEHIIPRARKGSHDRKNLAFSCLGCNNFKYNFTEARDPLTGEMAPLYHPRRQRWTDHFAWSDDFAEIYGVTPVGRATVARLQLNRRGLKNLRAVLVSAGRHPPRHSLP